MIALAKERFTKDLWSDHQSGQKPLIVTGRDEIDEAVYPGDLCVPSQLRGETFAARIAGLSKAAAEI